MKVEEKVALVTGGANGIGKTLCATLLDKGAKLVAVLDLNEALGSQTVEEFAEKYGKDRLKFLSCDVTDSEQVKSAFHEVTNVHGTLDIVVNNAGISSKDYRKTVEVDLIGVINGVYASIEIMTKEKRAERGIVLNTASLAGLIITPAASAAYTAAKHGVVGLTKALPVSQPEFAKGDLRAVAICPALVMTDLLRNTDAFEFDENKALWDKYKDTVVPMSQVMDAFMMAIEDDDLNGALITVSPKGNNVIKTKINNAFN